MPSSYTFLKELVETQGYTLIMHVLYVNKEEAFLRAEDREKKTGRHIPKEVISERLEGIKNLWPSYLKLAKQCYLYESNNKSYKIIAMKKDSNLTILDKERYEAFLSQ